MGKGTGTCAGQDWTHEGRRSPVLAARNPGKQPKAGARQRDCQSAAFCHEGKYLRNLFAAVQEQRLTDPSNRPAFLTTSRFALAAASLTASITHSSFSRTRRTRSTVSVCASGRAPMRSGLRQFASSGNGPSPTFTITPRSSTGFRTAFHSSRATRSTTSWATIFVACGFTGTRLPIFSTPRRFPGS